MGYTAYNDGDDLTIFVGLGCSSFLILWVLSTFFEIVYVLLLAGAGVLLVLSLIVYSNYSFKRFPRFGYYTLGYLSVSGICLLAQTIYVRFPH